MNLADDRLASLRDISPQASLKTEGGNEYVYLPKLKFQVGAVNKELDALLCLTAEGAYLTRLFLAEPLPERPTVHGAGWATRTILGRTWHTWSWKDVPATPSLIQALLDHVRALA